MLQMLSIRGFDVADRLQYATTHSCPEEGEPTVDPPPGYRECGPWVYVESLGERNTRWVRPLVEDREARERAERGERFEGGVVEARSVARALAAGRLAVIDLPDGAVVYTPGPMDPDVHVKLTVVVDRRDGAYVFVVPRGAYHPHRDGWTAQNSTPSTMRATLRHAYSAALSRLSRATKPDALQRRAAIAALLAGLCEPR